MLRFDQQMRLPTLSEADYVHDVAYDHYGTRLALCTSSLRISIFSVPSAAGGGQEGTEESEPGRWTEVARMERAHSGPIWRLSWGHPEYGDPLASCSEDRTVNVWYGGSSPGAPSAAARKGSGAPPSWEARAIHQDDSKSVAQPGMRGGGEPRRGLACDGPVVDVRFAPAPLGLRLAACTADGKARVFECVNSMDLSKWEPDAQDLQTLGKATNANTSGGSGSAALDWRKVPFGTHAGDDFSEMLAVAGRGGRLAVWAKDKSSKWREQASAEAHPVGGGGVRDVAWCPNLCRPYEVVATCGAGATLWRVDLSTPDERQGGYKQKEATGDARCSIVRLAELMPPNHEACPVWRCSWNLTGTTLALCPESGEVSVWKADASSEWKPECEIDLA
eukprot:TRINITY_DN78735_c0_g1_i1.p1 TRINITY_DN78735_c0_g1~~TRINITY_DN78735_c0_g1_i1.p1  ORF type:complete len:391 (+),score=66.79 TRINITY_DN78735_c0_g1_i1:101-1273(+)